MYGALADTSSIYAGAGFYGPWVFLGNTGTNPNAGASVCVYAGGGDPTLSLGDLAVAVH